MVNQTMTTDNTRRVTVRARSLVNGMATKISLVDRGANRLPTRMLKNDGEKQMFDLDALFRRENAAKNEKPSEVIGVVVPAEQAEGYAAALKQESDADTFIIDTDNEDVKLIALKNDATLDDALILRGGENAPAVAVSHAQKMLRDWGYDSEQGFAGSVISNGFYSNVGQATEVLRAALFDIMEKADTNPVEEVQAILSEFNDYVTGLVTNVPTTAFKFEKLQPIAIEPTEEEADDAAIESGQKSESGATVTTEEEPKKDAASKSDSDKGKESAAKTDDGKTVSEEETDETDTATKNDSGLGADLLQALQALPEAVTTLTETVSGLKNEMSTLQDSVNAANDTAKKAEKLAAKAADESNFTIDDSEAGREDAEKSEEDLPQSKHSNIEHY
ncbi:hypothetical protein [Vibrio phage 29Fa.3]|nr:hypothetical protein [Vibrio phage 29Fa.3]